MTAHDLYSQACANAAAANRKRAWRQYRDPRPGEVESWLATHCNTIRREAHSEIRFNPCPTCGRDNKKRPSCQINTDTGLWRCHAKGCSGNWFSLTRAFGDPLPENDRYTDDPLRVDIAIAQKLLTSARKNPPSLVTSGKHPALLEYCHGRGLTDSALNDWRVASLGEHCLRWPIHVWGNGWQLVNAKIKRAIVPVDYDGAKSWFEISGGPTGILIGQHLIHARHGERLIVTEGEMDAMAGYSIGMRNIVSLPNGASSVNVASLLRYIPDTWEIWLCVDMDDAGNKCAELFYAQLGFERVARIMMPHKDLNAWLMADPDLTPERVLTAAKGVTALVGCEATQTGIAVRKYMQVGVRTAINLVDNRIIVDTPWPKLSLRLGGGLRTGQTTGLLAPSGVGKSTLINQWLIYAAAKGVKCGLISVEGDREELDINITQAITGWTGHDPGSDGFAAVANNMMVSEIEGYQVPWQMCSQEFQAMIENGAKLLAIDNLDFIMPRSDARVHDIKSQAYASFVEQARDNQVHTLVVWQPKKVDRAAAVNSGNQKGLSQTFQDSDNYLNINTCGSCRRIEIEKCRRIGFVPGDNSVLLRYHQSKRCLYEVPEDDHDTRGEAWRQATSDL